jgi:uncharacterized protein YndB with AHSA1/START domain
MQLQILRMQTEKNIVLKYNIDSDQETLNELGMVAHTCNPSSSVARGRRIEFHAKLAKPYLKKRERVEVGGRAQGAEHLSGRCKALGSLSVLQKEKNHQ